MQITVIDCESARIRPGLLAPPLACVTHVSSALAEASVLKRRFQALDLGGSQHRAKLLDRWESRGFVEQLLASDDLIVGHNVSFDFAVFAAAWPEVIPSIFEAYDSDRVSDTLIREKLGHIARGYKGFERKDGEWSKLNYSLEDVALRRLKIQLTKGDWQLRFGELIDVPIEQWPQGAKDYALTDADTTLLVWEHQQADHQGYLLDEFRQSRAAWWIQLMSCWGLHTDEEGVRKFTQLTQKKFDDVAEVLVEAGLLRKDGSRDTKATAARMVKAKGDQAERTPTGRVKLNSDCCERSGDPILVKYSELSSLKTILSTDVPLLLRGIHTPLQARFNTLLETGRTSSTPNVQNLRREVGPRECFVPREGWVYASADYSGFELRTMSQVCVSNGWPSKLAQALNKGNDPHLEVARRILGISYEEAEVRIEEDVVDKARQAAKISNFGYPGGLGFTRFVDFARLNYGVVLDPDPDEALKKAKVLKEHWLESWPEFKLYFDWIGKQCDQPFSQIKHLFSDRFRGDVSYTEAANSMFQGLAADAAKHAGFLISRACYVDEASVLYGCRLVNFVHDEFIVEVPDDQYAADAAEELARLMIVGANPFLPDVPPIAKPQLMRRWSKKAKALRDHNGRLIPWEWKEAA